MRLLRTATPRLTLGFLLASLVLGLLHHTDHILRYDHSGWPFRPEVTEFTFSLLVYPVILVAIWAYYRPLLRLACTALGLLFLAPTLAHIFLETPLHQYRTWAHMPEVNLLGVSSPALGIAAAAISVGLSVCTALAFLSALGDARARGH